MLRCLIEVAIAGEKSQLSEEGVNILILKLESVSEANEGDSPICLDVEKSVADTVPATIRLSLACLSVSRHGKTRAACLFVFGRKFFRKSLHPLRNRRLSALSSAKHE